MLGNRLDIYSGLSGEDKNTTNDNSYYGPARELITTSPIHLSSLMISENNIQGFSHVAMERSGA